MQNITYNTQARNDISYSSNFTKYPKELFPYFAGDQQMILADYWVELQIKKVKDSYLNGKVSCV